MTKEVTFTPEALQAVIAQAVAQALATREAKVPANKLVDGKDRGQPQDGYLGGEGIQTGWLWRCDTASGRDDVQQVDGRGLEG